MIPAFNPFKVDDSSKSAGSSSGGYIDLAPFIGKFYLISRLIQRIFRPNQAGMLEL